MPLPALYPKTPSPTKLVPFTPAPPALLSPHTPAVPAPPAAKLLAVDPDTPYPEPVFSPQTPLPLTLEELPWTPFFALAPKTPSPVVELPETPGPVPEFPMTPAPVPEAPATPTPSPGSKMEVLPLEANFFESPCTAGVPASSDTAMMAGGGVGFGMDRPPTLGVNQMACSTALLRHSKILVNPNSSW
jgi:hypothetical protein